jgi:hypothetical protein
MTKRRSVDYKKAFRAITKAAREAKLAKFLIYKIVILFIIIII